MGGNRGKGQGMQMGLRVADGDTERGVPGPTSASKDTLDFHLSSSLFIYVFNYVYVCMSVCGYVRVCR